MGSWIHSLLTGNPESHKSGCVFPSSQWSWIEASITHLLPFSHNIYCSPLFSLSLSLRRVGGWAGGQIKIYSSYMFINIYKYCSDIYKLEKGERDIEARVSACDWASPVGLQRPRVLSASAPCFSAFVHIFNLFVHTQAARWCSG